MSTALQIYKYLLLTFTLFEQTAVKIKLDVKTELFKQKIDFENLKIVQNILQKKA
jgi:hypothetical protein